MILAIEWYHYILATLFASVCVLLMLVILLQRGRGVGLSGAFGGVGGSAALGAKTGDVLTWVTMVLAAVFVLLAIGMNYVFVEITPETPAARTTPAPPGAQTPPTPAPAAQTPPAQAPPSGGPPAPPLAGDEWGAVWAPPGDFSDLRASARRPRVISDPSPRREPRAVTAQRSLALRVLSAGLELTDLRASAHWLTAAAALPPQGAARC